MPNALEAAMMSYLAYELKRPSFPNTFSPLSTRLTDVFNIHYYPTNRPIPWNSKLGAVRYLTAKGWLYYDSRNDDISGFQSIAFINHQTQEIVLAHRGTIVDQSLASKANIKSDIEILKGEHGNLEHDLGTLLCDLVSFITSLVRKIEEENIAYTISQTGHSLGGFLAEFGAAYLACPKPLIGDDSEFYRSAEAQHFFRLHVSRIKHANCITFDSLGSTNVLQKLSITAGLGSNTHYFLEPNIANTANLHNGERYILLSQDNNYCQYLDRSQNYSATIDHDQTINLESVFHTVDLHSLALMIDYFDASTGEAFNRQLITEWPTAVNTFLTSARITPPTFVRGQPWQQDIASMFKFGVFSMAHSITDGVSRFTHERQGNLVYENMATAPTRTIS